MRQAEVRSALLGLVLAGAVSAGAQTSAPAPVAPAPDIVTGVLGLAVAPEPGQPPSQTLRGGVALRLVREQRLGRMWTKLLSSSGQHGWAQPDADLAGLPLTVTAARPGLELSLRPPGDADFEAGASVTVPDGSTLQLLGASRASRVATQEDLMLPPWLSATLTPWPLVGAGALQGYVPLQALALAWPPVAVAAPSATPLPTAAAPSAHAQLAARGLLGLSQAPFLAALLQPLHASAPRPGVAALDLSGATGQRGRQGRLDGDWQGPLAAYASAAPAPGALASVLAFGQGKARAFVLSGSQAQATPPAVAFVAEDAPAIARVDEVDLDGDGLPEWLLEVVAIYGDGFYAELWVVDGRSLRSGLRMARLPLSRSSGEGGSAGGQDAAWWVDAATRRLYLWHSDASGSRLTVQRYAGRALTAPKSADGTALVELLRTDAHEAARQSALQAQADGAVVLPIAGGGRLQWLAAVPFASAARARAWKVQRAMPDAAVLVPPLRRQGQ